MKIKILDSLIDKRMDCISIMCSVSAIEYLSFIKSVYGSKGGIEGQRTPLKAKTAVQIRNRMIDDITLGAVLPPIVLGLLVGQEDYSIILDDKRYLDEIISREHIDDDLSLIDGMQRTTALLEVFNNKSTSDQVIRIEFWVTHKVNNLIYRMLVLNTAQIPWSLKRQLEVVFASLRKQINTSIEEIKLFQEDDNHRRQGAGQYQASHIIELFLNFSIRKPKMDIKEALVEEFARLDVINSTSDKDFTDIFIGSLKLLVNFDKCLSSVSCCNYPNLNKFKRPGDILNSHPARIGFMVAASQKIFGKPGFNHKKERIQQNYTSLTTSFQKFIQYIENLEERKYEKFFDLPELDERITVKSSKIGDFERNYFLAAFYSLFDYIENDALQESISPIWVAFY